MITDNLIKAFDSCLQRFCGYAYGYYDDPLDEHNTKNLMGILGVDNADFYKLYQWKNGLPIERRDYSIDIRILFAGNFVSLEDAIQIAEDNLEESLWEKQSLKPFFANYEGEYLLLETDGASIDFMRIFFYSPNLSYSVEPITYFDSLESMLNSIIGLYEEKAIWYDDARKVVEFEFDLIEKLCRELNPNSARWKE